MVPIIHYITYITSGVFGAIHYFIHNGNILKPYTTYYFQDQKISLGLKIFQGYAIPKCTTKIAIHVYAKLLQTLTLTSDSKVYVCHDNAQKKTSIISHVTCILTFSIEAASTSEDASSEPGFSEYVSCSGSDQQLVPHGETGRLQLVPHCAAGQLQLVPHCAAGHLQLVPHWVAGQPVPSKYSIHHHVSCYRCAWTCLIPICSTNLTSYYNSCQWFHGKLIW